MIKIKIAHIITMLELGGAQQNTLYTVERLDKSKYDVTLICGKGGLLDEEAKEKCVKVIFIPCLKARRIIPLVDIMAFLKLWRICKKERFTIVHTHSSKAGILGRWAARLAGVPVIIHTVHGWSFNDYQITILKKFYIWLERITANITTRLVAVSNKDVEIGLKLRIGRQGQYIVIRSGVEIEKFLDVKIDVLSKRKELELDPGRPVVGMVACLKPQKAPVDFVRVANEVRKKLPEAQFLLVGDGMMRTRVERLKDNLGLNGSFILTGWRRDIPEVMALLDVFCLTSLWEGLPRTIVEAVIAGVPVVATDVGGNSEVIKDGINGYLIKPQDVSKMANRIVELLNQSPSPYNPLHKLGRLRRLTVGVQFIEPERTGVINVAPTDLKFLNTKLDSSFDIKEMVKDIESLYNKLIKL